jgi:pyruvate dehydrogenase E1 component
MYKLKEGKKSAEKIQLMGCGTILREVEAAAQLLKDDHGIESDIWSLTSINELTRDGQACQRWNLLHPEAKPKVPYISTQLAKIKAPVICATDYLKAYGEQLRPFISNRYTVLGTDGFGRSDTRSRLRHHFEVDRHFIVVVALKALVDEGQLEAKVVTAAMKKYGIDSSKRDPMSC